jgi:hypothetical protein
VVSGLRICIDRSDNGVGVGAGTGTGSWLRLRRTTRGLSWLAVLFRLAPLFVSVSVRTRRPATIKNDGIQLMLKKDGPFVLGRTVVIGYENM